MISLLALGFLLGMRHALEADHLAAVATLASQSRGRREAFRLGAVWGLGHTLTLCLFAGLALVVGTAVPERLAQGLELAVALMLIALGADLVRRMLRRRVHVHVHSHADGVIHLHAHAHSGDEPHDPSRHRHEHCGGFPVRALMVGSMHGMAGSAALIMLTLGSVHSALTGLLYVALFGVGSIVGMGVLSVVIAVPMWYSARRATVACNVMQLAVGAGTIALGLVLVSHNPIGIELGASMFS